MIGGAKLRSGRKARPVAVAVRCRFDSVWSVLVAEQLLPGSRSRAEQPAMNRDYQPGFATALMLKDLKLAGAASQAAGASTPMGGLAAQLQPACRRHGPGRHRLLQHHQASARHRQLIRGFQMTLFDTNIQTDPFIPGATSAAARLRRRNALPTPFGQDLPVINPATGEQVAKPPSARPPMSMPPCRYARAGRHVEEGQRCRPGQAGGQVRGSWRSTRKNWRG